MIGIAGSRRGFLFGIGGVVVAPMVVRAENLMKVGNVDKLLYPPRGIIVYNIASDTMDVRVDRANFTLATCFGKGDVFHVLSQREIEKLFTREQLISIKPTNRVERQQRCIAKPFSCIEWNLLGLLPLQGQG